MSFPSPNVPSQALQPAPPPEAPSRRPRRAIWLVLLIAVGGCVFVQAPREIGRWELASALSARDAGEKAEANKLLADVAKRFPDNLSLMVQKADWLTEGGDNAAASAEWDRILELPIDDAQTLILRSQLLQNAGRFADAVKEWNRLNQMSERSGHPSRASVLNGLAYAQALAGTEIDDGLNNVTKALDLAHGELAFTAAASDTRGFLFYLKGEYELALADMNVAVPLTEMGIREVEIRTGVPIVQPAGRPAHARRAEQLSSEQRRLVTSQSQSMRQITRSTSTAHGLAVIYYHRALVLKALGEKKAAATDFSRARQLIGREPDASLF